MNIPPLATRRSFLKRSATTAVVLANAKLTLAASGAGAQPTSPTSPLPWYRRTLRWGQTNITEMDPEHYDVDWWRQHWRRTRVQGVIINAGGIVAYYPSKFPLDYRAAGLGQRDLYDELAQAAHADGLAVLARMDSNRAHEDFYQAQPDWIARDANGEPYRNTGYYVTCVNSAYYDEYIPAVLREIIERSHPEGFGDNNWSGLERDKPCFCENCERKFKARTGQPIPRRKNWDDPLYRQWIQWNYERRLEIWDLFNRTTREAGGPNCLWLGMNGTLLGQCQRFRDYKGICERSEFLLLDSQSRNHSTGFQQNGETGKFVHGLLGWDKLVPESMAMYQAGQPTFRLAAKPEAEARLWMLEGFAGGIQPWWHHVGAYQEDRRMFRTAEPIMRWHAENEHYLINRRPVATVGLVWSQANMDFFGRDHPEELVELPWRGWTNALVHARIPYLPVHADHITRDASQFAALILPNLAAMNDAQTEAVRQFVAGGGSLVATGQSSRCNEWGEPRGDFALADLFGAHAEHAPDLDLRARGEEAAHTYLRLRPELGAGVYGPKSGQEPTPMGQRHAVLNGFEDTDILPFGGTLEALRVDPSATVLATFIPAFPVYPPESVWMRQPHTDIPGLVLNEHGAGGRIAYLPAQLDRCYGRDNLPDHARLLTNLVRWAAGERLPLSVEGPGFVDCHLYQQGNRLVLHLVNLTNAATWRAPVDELIPIGPLTIGVRLPPGVESNRLQLLVSKRATKATRANGWVRFELRSILDHEVVVIG